MFVYVLTTTPIDENINFTADITTAFKTYEGAMDYIKVRGGEPAVMDDGSRYSDYGIDRWVSKTVWYQLTKIYVI